MIHIFEDIGELKELSPEFLKQFKVLLEKIESPETPQEAKSSLVEMARQTLKNQIEIQSEAKIAKDNSIKLKSTCEKMLESIKLTTEKMKNLSEKMVLLEYEVLKKTKQNFLQ